MGAPDPLTRASAWVEAVLAAGATPASYVPEASAGRTDIAEVAGAELVEDTELVVHELADGWRPPAAAFLDGIQHWRVVAYDGVTPVVRARVAAAVRRRGADRRLVTALEASHDFAVTR
ncbi:MAG: hypothetical protein ACREMJ_07085, partial [Gemmatimonadales bacterium]